MSPQGYQQPQQIMQPQMPPAGWQPYAAAPHLIAGAAAAGHTLDDAPLPPAPQFFEDDDTAFTQLMALSAS